MCAPTNHSTDERHAQVVYASPDVTAPARSDIKIYLFAAPNLGLAGKRDFCAFVNKLRPEQGVLPRVRELDREALRAKVGKL